MIKKEDEEKEEVEIKQRLKWIFPTYAVHWNF